MIKNELLVAKKCNELFDKEQYEECFDMLCNHCKAVKFNLNDLMSGNFKYLFDKHTFFTLIDILFNNKKKGG